MTAALEEGEWSAGRPGRTLPPGKNRCPFYRRLDGPQGRSGRAENLVLTGIRSRSRLRVTTAVILQNWRGIPCVKLNQPQLCSHLFTAFKTTKILFYLISSLHTQSNSIIRPRNYFVSLWTSVVINEEFMLWLTVRINWYHRISNST